MAKRDPFRYSKGWGGFESLRELYEKMQHQPFTGVTQGGSSRKDAGAESAASAKAVGAAAEPAASAVSGT
jgi:hypothetical protein